MRQCAGNVDFWRSIWLLAEFVLLLSFEQGIHRFTWILDFRRLQFANEFMQSPPVNLWGISSALSLRHDLFYWYQRGMQSLWSESRLIHRCTGANAYKSSRCFRPSLLRLRFLSSRLMPDIWGSAQVLKHFSSKSTS